MMMCTCNFNALLQLLCNGPEWVQVGFFYTIEDQAAWNRTEWLYGGPWMRLC